MERAGCSCLESGVCGVQGPESKRSLDWLQKCRKEGARYVSDGEMGTAGVFISADLEVTFAHRVH